MPEDQQWRANILWQSNMACWKKYRLDRFRWFVHLNDHLVAGISQTYLMTPQKYPSDEDAKCSVAHTAQVPTDGMCRHAAWAAWLTGSGAWIESEMMWSWATQSNTHIYIYIHVFIYCIRDCIYANIYNINIFYNISSYLILYYIIYIILYYIKLHIIHNSFFFKHILYITY